MNMRQNIREKYTWGFYLSVLASGYLLAGCGDSPDHARAKMLMSEFTCPSYNGQWGRLMKHDLEKANIFLGNFENGKHFFNMPIDKLIEGQLRQFRIACEASESEAQSRK